MPKLLKVAVDRIVRHIIPHTPRLVFKRRFLLLGAFNNSAERGKANIPISQLRSSASPPRFPPRYLVLSLVPFLLVTAYLLWPTFLQSIRALPWIEAPHVKAQGTQSAEHEHPAPTTQIIYAPTTGLPQASRAELVLNNNGPDEMVVTPTLYSKDGNPNVCDQITLKPAEVRRFPVAGLASATAQTEGNAGGISLSYFGGMLELGAQIALFGEGRAGSVDVSFSGAGDYRSTVQEAVWWSPGGASATLAIGNASDGPIDVKLIFSSGQEQQVQVGPFATEVLTYKNPKARGGGAESVRLEVSGPVGSIRTAGYVRSANNDFTSTVRFYDPQKVRQPNLYGTNLKLEKSTPHLVLKNISDSPISATPRFLPLDGVTGSLLELPPVTLAAREAREVDLSPLLAGASGRDDFKMVSVEVINDGPTASLIGSLCSSDRTSLITYDAPLRDSGPVRRSTGSYPYRMDDDYSTLVTITNISQKRTNFAGLISFEGGQYVLEQRRVEVGATAVLDLNRIRDEQIPDRDGRTIPQSVTEGQFVWSIVGGAKEEKLIGRMQIVSRANRVSRSYSCETCCPWSFNQERVSPSSVNVVVGGTAGLTAEAQYYQNCNGNYWLSPWYTAIGFAEGNGEWLSGDQAIATVSPTNIVSTTLTAVSGGATYVSASWEALQWMFNSGIDDCSSFPIPAVAYSNVQVTPLTVTVNEVGFTGDHQITKWVGGAVIDNPDGSSPTWKSSGNPNLPTAYTKGAKPTMFLKLGISPTAPSISAKIRVFRDATVIAMKDITLSGTSITVTGLTSSAALENNVIAVAPMFDWDISYDGGNNWEHIADTGPHTLYFTWAAPLSPPFSNFGGSTFAPLYDLALEKACGPSNGASDIATVASRINERVAVDTIYNPGAGLPGHPLSAYSEGCACGPLAHLLRGLIRSIGIDGPVQYVWAGPNSSTQRKFIVGSAGDAGTFNPTFRVIRAAHPDGIAPENPHFIYHAVVPVSGTLYDPSYGSSYATLSFDETANLTTPQQTSTTFPGSTPIQSGWVCPH